MKNDCMILEAVWFKDGKEVAWVSPVQVFVCRDNIEDIAAMEVYNGLGWYQWQDIVDEKPDDFVIRIKKEN